MARRPSRPARQDSALKPRLRARSFLNELPLGLRVVLPRQRAVLLQRVLNDDPMPPRSLNDKFPRDPETICPRQCPTGRNMTIPRQAPSPQTYAPDSPAIRPRSGGQVTVSSRFGTDGPKRRRAAVKAHPTDQRGPGIPGNMAIPGRTALSVPIVPNSRNQAHSRDLDRPSSLTESVTVRFERLIGAIGGPPATA